MPYAALANPQSLNLYSFVGNDPLTHGDLDGHCYPLCDVLTWAIGRAVADGGAKQFAKNVGIGAVKGAGSFAVNTLKGALATYQRGSGHTQSAERTLSTPQPQALQPSNTTQAQVSVVTQVALTAAAVLAPAALESGAARGMSQFGGVFSAETNAAGGVVHTSVGAIGQSDVGTIVNSAMYSGDEINILSGVHGAADGTMTPGPELFEEDLALFGDLENVTVHDMTTLTPAQVKSIVNGPGTTIGAFCNSGACLPLPK